MSRLLVFLLPVALIGITCAYPADIDINTNTDVDIESRNSRIVGGYVTSIIALPHQVTLRYKSLFEPDNAYRHRCGGSIADSKTIITAAHCVISTVPSQYKIVAGTNHRLGGDGVIVNVVDIIMHENYNGSTYDNDIAIMLVDPPLPLNNFTISAIELADTDAVPGSMSTVSGWGTTSSGGVASDVLLATEVPIVSNEDCDLDYSNGAGRITPSMLCAGIRGVGGKDACQGDSGGPLTIRNKLHGVVSWGWGCALAEYPGVYAKVPYLLDWIKSKVTLE